MKLFIIRHGETNYNKMGKTAGQVFNHPLNDKGIEQAKSISKNLPSEINAIFSSPLKRARQTAEIINKNYNLKIGLRDELMERNYGSLSGKTWEDMAKESGIPNLKEIDYAQKYDYHRFGGESINDVKSRLLNFIEYLNTNYKNGKVVIVTHGGILKIMHNEFPQKERPEIGNATIHEFEI
ncbi:MAG: histidine phosphatase family protein [Minisyncoccia bacterium]|jgi:broad specificity phosphatase PhoE